MRLSSFSIDHRDAKLRVSVSLALIGAIYSTMPPGTAGADTVSVPHIAPNIDATLRAKNGEDQSISTVDLSSLCETVEAYKFAAIAVEGGFLARNHAQRWRLRFDGRSFVATPDSGRWSWGLELINYGRAGAEQTVSIPTCADAIGGRVSYEWDDSLTEWYVNEGRGLEHGYTVLARPSGDQRTPAGALLQFRLAVRGNLTPRIENDGRCVAFVDGSGADVVNYSGLTVFDADGIALPAWFELLNSNQTTSELRLSVDDQYARYPLTIDPIAQQAYLKASNTGGGDLFGWSVAMSGDTVVVGALAEDSNAPGVNGDQTDNSLLNAGAVYVFVRNGTSWTQQAYLKASNPDGAAPSGDEFGNSVAISGDTVVVGAQGEDSSASGINGDQSDNSASEAGAAYVFVRNGTTWTQQAYLKSSNIQAGDLFSASVAVSGDTVVVGAAFEDSNATGVNGNEANNSASNSGAVYVFVRSGSTWTQQAYLKASNTDADDFFGWSVAISGDTVVVGARNEDSNSTGVNGNQANNNNALNSGAAYVFIRNGTSWSQQAYLKASNTGGDDNFGRQVAISGDTLVIGTSQEDSNAVGVNGNQADNSASASGAAYVFARNQTIWSQQAYLKSSNTGAFDQFGSAVTVSGETIVVGASGEGSNATGLNGDQTNNSAGGSGAAYVFRRDGPTWSPLAYVKASNTGPSDSFGSSLALSGSSFAIGAPFERSNATGIDGNQADNSLNNAGAVYVFAEVGAFILGDLSCDGEVDSADIAPFILALLDPSAACNILNGDIFPDGNVDGGDVQAFVDLLIP